MNKLNYRRNIYRLSTYHKSKLLRPDKNTNEHIQHNQITTITCKPNIFILRSNYCHHSVMHNILCNEPRKEPRYKHHPIIHSLHHHHYHPHNISDTETNPIRVIRIFFLLIRTIILQRETNKPILTRPHQRSHSLDDISIHINGHRRFSTINIRYSSRI
jgi:hypothetical protein